jgi:hypothetical protein
VKQPIGYKHKWGNVNGVSGEHIYIYIYTHTHMCVYICIFYECCANIFVPNLHYRWDTIGLLEKWSWLFLAWLYFGISSCRSHLKSATCSPSQQYGWNDLTSSTCLQQNHKISLVNGTVKFGLSSYFIRDI